MNLTWQLEYSRGYRSLKILAWVSLIQYKEMLSVSNKYVWSRAVICLSDTR